MLRCDIYNCLGPILKCGTHKLFFLDFDNDSYAQNSEIIKTIRIQKIFLKIPIGKLFSKIDPLSSLTDTTIVV